MGIHIGFYVHHHGSGHLMRTLQVVEQIKDYQIILFGSALKGLSNLAENVTFVHLPLDLPEPAREDLPAEKPLGMLHYAPLLVPGITDRVAILTTAFKKFFPMILVVDVSVEVTLLARLSSIPTLVVRQHGLRTDPAHLIAYESAEKLIAPFSSSLHAGKKDWVFKKTVFTGGFSRFDHRKPIATVVAKRVAVLIGRGGSSINKQFIKHLANLCEDYNFHILGDINPEEHFPNVRYVQHCDDPFDELSQAAIIIGNTGHNTVMEVASMNKPFIGIPEPRPFFEQEDKAASISPRTGLEIIYPSQLYRTDWSLILSELTKTKVNWDGIIDEYAVKNFALEITLSAAEMFNR